MDEKPNVVLNSKRRRSHKTSITSESLATLPEAKELQDDAGVEEEVYTPTIPDGGYGWIIMIASFFQSFIVDGVAFCFGVHLQIYIEYFNSDRATVCVMSSVLCGMYLFVAPVVGALINNFGVQKVGIAGSLISAVAFLLCTATSNIIVMIIVYGLIGGIGFGMIYIPSIVIVSFYFEKKRAIATGVAMCGTGIGTFALAPLCAWFLQVFDDDWRSSHFILAGIILQSVVFAALMRPIEPKKVLPSEEPSSHGTEDSSAPMIPKDHRTQNGGMNGSVAGKGSAVLVGRHPRAASTSSFLASGQGSMYLRPRTGTRGSEDLNQSMLRKDVFLGVSVASLVPKSKASLAFPTVPNGSTVVSNGTEKGGPAAQNHEEEEYPRKRLLDCLPTTMANVLYEMCDFSLLKNKQFSLLLVGNFLAMSGFYVPIFFTPNRAESMGFSKTEASMLVSVIGITNTVGRVLFGLVASIPYLTPLGISNVSLVIAGISTIVTPFCFSYGAMVTAAAGYGLFCAAFISLTPVILCNTVGLEKLTTSFGLLNLVRGSAAVIGPPVEGLLYDYTQSYADTFYLGGLLLLAGAGCMSLLHLPYIKRLDSPPSDALA